MSNEEIRAEEEEEVIEVVAEDGDSDEPVGRGVDIIGDRPVRKAQAQQPPGCLYSFLLFLIGLGVGWLAYYAFDQELGKGDVEEQTFIAQVTEGKGRIQDLADAEKMVALDSAIAQNYGLAVESLAKVQELLSIASVLDSSPSRQDEADLEGIMNGLKSEEPKVREEALKKLATSCGEEGEAKLAEAAAAAPTPESGETEATEGEATTEATAEPAAEGEGAETADAATTEEKAEPAEPKTDDPVAAPETEEPKTDGE